MPHAWALVESSFPTFTKGESPQKQITALIDYMMILTEALQYQLENLDKNNWNSTALDNFQVDTTKDVSEQLAAVAQQLAAVTNEVTEMKNHLSAVEGRTAQAETSISYLEAGQEEAQQEIARMQEQMGNAQSDIDTLQQEMAEQQAAVRQDADGNVTIGAAGKNVYLTGNIYINGVLME